jgi:hypothetical protein
MATYARNGTSPRLAPILRRAPAIEAYPVTSAQCFAR